ncbi:MAG: S6e family ribosomal protein [archaeon]
MFKINISNKEKTYNLESDSESLEGKKIGEKFDGKEINSDLSGYELEITGTSDKAGFPGLRQEEGPNLRKVLLSYEKGMKVKPRKEGKKGKTSKPEGLRLKKTVRGNQISKDTVQINLKVLKAGSKKIEEIFKKEAAEEKPAEDKKEEK